MIRPIDAIFQALEREGFDPRWTGRDSGEARCPGHDGSRRNLSIGLGDDGRVLLCCHHNPACPIETIVENLGMMMADLFPYNTGVGRSEPLANGKATAKTGRRAYPTPEAALAGPVRKYGLPADHCVYHHADGSEALRVYRFDFTDFKTGEPDKSYRPVHPTPEGWRLGDPPGRLPLYHLPDLAGAPRIFVTEGEKCADLTRRLGLTATTSAHGAGSPHKSDWGPLAGKDVIILPDAGNAGEAYAKDVVGQLAKLAPRPTVRIVRLPVGGDGDDIEEWLRDVVPDDWDPEQCRAELERLAHAASVEDLDAGRAEPHSPPAASSATGDDRLILTCMTDVRPEPIEWLEERIIPLGKLVIVAGEGGAGKSSLALEWVARVTRGQSLFSRPPIGGRPSGSVILVSCEDGAGDTVVPRLLAAGADLSRVHKIDGVRGPDGRPIPFGIHHVELLERTLDRMPETRLIVLDPIASLVGRAKIDDHHNSELAPALTDLSEIATRHRVAVIGTVNLSKAQSPRAVHRILGGVAYVNVARAAFVAAREPQSERRVLSPVKFNLGPEPKSLAYEIRPLAPQEQSELLSRPEFSALTPEQRSAISTQLSRVAWKGESNTTADECLASEGRDREAPVVKRAQEFLRRVVKPRPIRAPEVYRQAEANGIAERTLKRAKGKEEIESIQIEGERGWWWRYVPSEGQGARGPEGHDGGENGRVGPLIGDGEFASDRQEPSEGDNPEGQALKSGGQTGLSTNNVALWPPGPLADQEVLANVTPRSKPAPMSPAYSNPHDSYDGEARWEY